MIILGVTMEQANILEMSKRGLDYTTMAHILEMTEHEVMQQEMIALANLSTRWNKTEAEVMKLLRTMFLLVLCMLPTLNGDGIERVARSSRLNRLTQTIKTVRGRRESQPLDILSYDV